MSQTPVRAMFNSIPSDSSEADSRASHQEHETTNNGDNQNASADLHHRYRQLKIDTMHNVVEDMAYLHNDGHYACNFLFLTNPHAMQLNRNSFDKLQQAFGMDSSKLIIRLMPSLYYPQYHHQRWPEKMSIDPFAQDSELTQESSDRVRAQLMLFASTVLLPLARETNAFVIGSRECGLMDAFVTASAPYLRQAEDSGFQILCYTYAPLLHVSATSNGNSVAAQLKSQSEEWKRMGSEYEKALRGREGFCRKYWTQYDLPAGASHYVVFDGVTSTAKTTVLEFGPGNQFINRFVSHVASSVPVISLCGFGMNLRTDGLHALADYVQRNLPLLLIDCRERWKVIAETRDDKVPEMKDIVHATISVVPDASLPNHVPHNVTHQSLETKKTGSVSSSVQPGRRHGIEHVIAKIASFRTQLHKGNRADNYYTSVLARLKREVDCSELPDSQGQLWLHQAISEAILQEQAQSRGSRITSTQLETKSDSEPVVCAVEAFLNHVGDTMEFFSEGYQKTARVALESLLESTTWEDLCQAWEENYTGLYNIFKRRETVESFRQKVDFLYMKCDDHYGESLAINRSNPQGVEEAKTILQELLTDALHKSKQYDNKFLSKRSIVSNSQLWFSTQTIMQSPHVYVGNLFELKRCSDVLAEMANMHRLPKKNSLEAMVLLRCAWTLHDAFSIEAASQKLLTKLAYGLTLLLGLAVVAIVTVSSATSDLLLESSMRYLTLCLSLATGFICGWTVFLDPLGKWLQLKQHALALESEIWKFRTRVSPYQSDRRNKLSLKSDRAAEQYFHDVLVNTQEAIAQNTGLRKTIFFSVATSTSQLLAHTDLPSQLPKYCVKHHQFSIPGKEVVKVAEGEDDHHSPVQPDDYLKWRLQPALVFFQKRIPGHSRQRLLLQAIMLCASVAGSILSITNLPQWTAILSTSASAMAAWQEFSNVSKKLDRYSTTCTKLSRLLLWWQSLPPIDQQHVTNIELLVDRTEDLLGNDRSAWAADLLATAKSFMETTKRVDTSG